MQPEVTPPEPTPPVIRLRKILTGAMPASVWPDGGAESRFWIQTSICRRPTRCWSKPTARAAARWRRVPFLKELAVAPAWRRRGVGCIRDRGAGFVDLKVQRANPWGGKRLHRRQGTREVV